MAIAASAAVLGADEATGDCPNDGFEMVDGAAAVIGGLEITASGRGDGSDGLEIDSDGANEGLLIDGLVIGWDDDEACDPDVPDACAPLAVVAESGVLTASTNAKPIDQNGRAKRMK